MCLCYLRLRVFTQLSTRFVCFMHFTCDFVCLFYLRLRAFNFTCGFVRLTLFVISCVLFYLRPRAFYSTCGGFVRSFYLRLRCFILLAASCVLLYLRLRVFYFTCGFACLFFLRLHESYFTCGFVRFILLAVAWFFCWSVTYSALSPRLRCSGCIQWFCWGDLISRLWCDSFYLLVSFRGFGCLLGTSCCARGSTTSWSGFDVDDGSAFLGYALRAYNSVCDMSVWSRQRTYPYFVYLST